MKSNEIRAGFHDYFKSKGHSIVASSSLVPAGDPTLLFVNSGMVQFKDVFLGKEKRPYSRATTSQRCVRAGGKHNDLENVGYTARHHTFFEMLGNFSFGDYFKKDAIAFAWELLTKVYQLPPGKLWTTVYQTDDEAYELWTKMIGVPPERCVRIGDKPGAQKYQSDNFWQMADTGPCGPCSEIFYDHGPGIEGGPPGTPEADGDRYIEIWNLVFMQFDRDDQGVMHPLPKPSVDTGMGLERIAAVLQGKHSNYEIDLFQDLIRAAARETGQKPLKNPSLNVIADHIRACSFLVVDGVIPGNEGRGYVLRRIIRRAIRHGYKLGRRAPFFYRLVEDLDRVMGDAYPELGEGKARVADVLRQEEERFFETIERGMGLLERGLRDESLVIHNLRRIYNPVEIGIDGTSSQSSTGLQYSYDARFELPNHDQVIVEFKRASDGASKIRDAFSKTLNFFSNHGDALDVSEVVLVVIGDISDSLRAEIETLARSAAIKTRIVVVDSETRHQYRTLDGRIAFTLHDTYGFPLDLTADVARERAIEVDEVGFEAAMEEQRRKARGSAQFSALTALAYGGARTLFRGYDTLAAPGKVVALYRAGTPVEALRSGEEGTVVLDQTPFYAESGGQVGDRGELVAPTGTFEVADTQKIQAEVFGHQGTLKTGTLKAGDTVEARVDTALRARTMRNHSVTHLMHKALREVLGPHVQQKGSLVDADKTRFDFAHDKAMSEDELRSIEALVNTEILANTPTKAQIMPIEDAKRSGAVMLFGEKYGDEVRVLDIGSSREFCGGTHVARTGDIGLFKIVDQSAVAAGVRRVEAKTGEGALAWVQAQEAKLRQAAAALRSPVDEVDAKIAQVLENVKSLEREMARLKSRLASGQGTDLAGQAVDVKGAKVVAATLDGADAKTLREAVDRLKDQLKSAAIVLGAVADGKVALIAGVTADLTGKVKAGELVNYVAQQVGGKGGGRPDMAQAGGTEAAKLPAALQSVRAWVEQRI